MGHSAQASACRRGAGHAWRGRESGPSSASLRPPPTQRSTSRRCLWCKIGAAHLALLLLPLRHLPLGKALQLVAHAQQRVQQPRRQTLLLQQRKHHARAPRPRAGQAPRGHAAAGRLLSARAAVPLVARFAVRCGSALLRGAGGAQGGLQAGVLGEQRCLNQRRRRPLHLLRRRHGQGGDVKQRAKRVGAWVRGPRCLRACVAPGDRSQVLSRSCGVTPNQ